MRRDEGLIRIDPDQPVYRIFSIRCLEETLRLSQLTLVPSQKCEDPFEHLAERVAITDTRTTPWTQTPIERFLKPAYGQCWSRTHESDTLWRAYSKVSKDTHFNRNACPSEEGVRVRSTPSKLLNALSEWHQRAAYSCFVGAVCYRSEDEIKKHIANSIERYGETAFVTARARADLLLPNISKRREVTPRIGAQLAKPSELRAPSELGLTCDAKRRRRLGGRL